MSSDDLKPLYEALRKACPPRAWSRGVILAREQAVEGKEEHDGELVLAVRVSERPVPLSVVFYLETLEWDCECDAPADACAHAAAAIIALVQAREAGRRFPGAPDLAARIRYRFRRSEKVLSLERLLVAPDGAITPVSAEEMRRAALGGRRLSITEADLALEPLLPGTSVEVTRLDQTEKLLGALADASELHLDDRPVRVSREALLPRGTVTGDERAVTFTIDRDPSIEEVIAAGLALADGELRLLGELGLSGVKLEKLPIVRRFTRAELAELVLEVLPLYRRRFEVDVRAPLPSAGGAGKPRLDLRIEFEDGGVAVAPELLYGTPPRLRIEDKRPIYLGGAAIPERDLAQERRLVERLRGELNLVTGRRVAIRGADAQRFVEKLRDFQRDEGGEEVIPRLVPSLSIEGEGDRFTLDFTSEDGTQVGALQVLRAFENRQELVPLLGGGWAELPRAFLAEHAERISLLLSLRGEDGRLPLFAMPALAKLAEALEEAPPAAMERLAPLFLGFERLPKAPLPNDLTATLRPYQRTGVDWLVFLRDAGLGAVLADDMGLGKTLQTLCALRGRTLIVCPTSVLPNWAAELARFRPALSVCLYHGPGRVLRDDADVVITTYALLRIDAEKLSAIEWDAAILDEAQAIKNSDSQTARTAYALRAKWRVALTGTPIENRLEELWSQLHYTNPGLLLGRSDFTARFSKPIGEGDAAAASRLRERIRPFVLRRMKRDVARDLPPRTDMVLFAELDEAERAVYDAVKLATREEVVAKIAQGASVLAALEALLRLRQAACHSALVPGQSFTGAPSSKIATLVESLAEVIDEGHKALVFSQWTSLLDLIEPALSKASLSFVRLDGSTRDRGAIVADFMREGGPPVMIISLKAGGTGLNLTAADHVFLMDPWWNPAVEDQAADRAHRIGQERPVMVYRLVARDTVEERILELQARKRAVADVALAEADAAAALTREDLLALLD